MAVEAKRRLVTFVAGGIWYGIDGPAVREVRTWDMKGSAPLPASYLPGASVDDGAPVPLLDLGGQQANDRGGRFVVLVSIGGGATIGVVADEVAGTVDEALATDIINSELPKHAEKVLDVEGQRLVVLSVAALASSSRG